MSLTNPTKKMSKSDENPKSRILITDTKEVIQNKLKSALTDSVEGVSYDPEGRPGVSNLIDLMYHIDESVAASPEELAKDLEGLSMRALKEKVADVVDEGIRDVREKYEEVMAMPGSELRALAKKGEQQAGSYAGKTLGEVKRAVGLSTELW